MTELTKKQLDELGEKCKFFKKIRFTHAIKMDDEFEVKTANGNIAKGKKGDYLAWDSEGLPYPIALDVFVKTYKLDELLCIECGNDKDNPRLFISADQEEWTMHHYSTGH